MKSAVVVAFVLVLAACKSLPVQVPVEVKPEPEPQRVIELPLKAPEPVVPQLAISDEALSLQAWSAFRSDLLKMNLKQREALHKELPKDAIGTLQQLLIRIHPDTPYSVRFKAQTELAEQLQTLPTGLAAMLRWDHAFNQKLLESESAVKALGRLNGQQQDTLEKLQQQNLDLQKKIEALTQIEAGLNQGNGG